MRRIANQLISEKLTKWQFLSMQEIWTFFWSQMTLFEVVKNIPL